MSRLSRTPPRDVLRKLRREVAFCCPVEGCGRPYLTWHHFDPPWRVENHHRPEGMIALCREHADKADHGSFTDDQLRQLKRDAASRANDVRGQFNWMRQDLLAVVGGNFFHRVETIFTINDSPIVGFERDEQRNLLLNFRIPTVSNSPRAQIFQNWWTVPPAVEDLICPPGGRLLEVTYGNGDRFRAEFFDMESAEKMVDRYSGFASWVSEVPFPITVVEVWETAADTPLEFSPEYIRWEDGGIVNCLFTDVRSAIKAEVPANLRAYLLSDRLPHA